MLGIMRNLILRLISTDASLATHVNALNFNHINKIETRYKVLRSNMKLDEVLLLRLCVTFPSYIASILFANVNFTHILTEKLHNSGNQPLVRNTFCC